MAAGGSDEPAGGAFDIRRVRRPPRHHRFRFAPCHALAEAFGKARFERIEGCFPHATLDGFDATQVAKALQDARPSLPGWRQRGTGIAGQCHVVGASAFEAAAQGVQDAAAAPFRQAPGGGMPQSFQHHLCECRRQRGAKVSRIVANAAQRDELVEGATVKKQAPLAA